MSREPSPTVEAYAGVRYPERPVRVFWRGRWCNVDRVEHQEQRPDCRCFTVRLALDDLSQDDTRCSASRHVRHAGLAGQALQSILDGGRVAQGAVLAGAVVEADVVLKEPLPLLQGSWADAG